MEIERRALYNLLRINWLEDSSLDVEPWQVEDYRALSLEELFSRLEEQEVVFGREEFLVYAGDCESPEEVTECLADDDADIAEMDQIYLIVFELWRRLVTDNPSLSIFCDELDHQIILYDQHEEESDEALQDVLANLEQIIEDSVDEGEDSQSVFESVATGCANDIESFLYDYISEQIDGGQQAYAVELLEGFGDCVADVRGMTFLRARIRAVVDSDGANEMVREMLEADGEEPLTLDFVFDMLYFMVQSGEQGLFVELVQKALPLLAFEEDFQDLIAITADFFRCLDMDEQDQFMQGMLERRASRDGGEELDLSDADVELLSKIVRESCADRAY